MKASLLIAALALSACTTVSNGPMQRVFVDSDPRGANVEVRRCGAMATKATTTPGLVWVSRRSTQCEIVLRMPEFKEERVKLRRHVARQMHRYSDAADIYMAMDPQDEIGAAIFLTGLLVIPSFAVDAASGAMFELEPNSVNVTLTPDPQEWRQRGVAQPGPPRN